MNGTSKIVGIARQSQEIMPQNEAAIAAIEPSPLSMGTSSEHEKSLLLDEFEVHDNQEWIEETPNRQWKSYVFPSLICVALAGWTAFFAWSLRAEPFPISSNERLISLIGAWALPASLLGVVWLLMMRNSSVEANRFGNVAALLRRESEALEKRMQTVNEEIAMARAFLAENARELESIGRHSASNLLSAAQELSSALADSDAKAKTLESVSSAAATNLEQLRKHLPVVTSAAKDVTNQIGTAGNSAKEQMKAMIDALQNVTAAGEEANAAIDGMEAKSSLTTSKIGTSIQTTLESLNKGMATAHEQSEGLVIRIGTATNGLTQQIGQATSKIDTLVERNAKSLNDHIESLRSSMDELKNQSLVEESRIAEMIAQVTAHVSDREKQLAAIDHGATDRAAKLAFSFEALVVATEKLQGNLDANYTSSDALVEKSERLLLALDSANRELDESLPAAFDRAEQRFASSLNHMDKAMQRAKSLEEHSDDMLAKIATIDDLMMKQDAAMSMLMSVSDSKFAEHISQAENLTGSLSQTRDMMVQIVASTDEGLTGTLNRIRETSTETAEMSRQLLQQDMSEISSQLSQQSHDAVKAAIDGQVETFHEMVQSSFERNILLSEVATQKLSAQLSQIDEMTLNLESRLADAREGFTGIDDDSFARQMVTLTETLNSTAIDVAKILSNEVTDTAWAAYLKGDRGVFTRRAVKLLDNSEAKIITTYYDEDPEFRENVNRYIHDFESMMRVLLSTRDGNAIGVTLLSSDVGKLYVALAQAIERLRN
jgi:hypothetical protein